MFKVIEGLPTDVLGVEATGKVTHADYVHTLIPNAESIMARGPLKLIFLIGTEFTGFELEALWDDATFGLRHWRELEGHRNPAHLLLAGEYTNDPRRHGRGAQGARGTHFTSGKQVVKQAPKQGTPVLPASVTHCKLIGTAGFEPATP